DSEFVDPDQIRKMMPLFNNQPDARYQVAGGFLQKRGGVARHDAVAWGYARAADAFGIDIIQQCEVTGIRRDGDRAVGVETSRGFIGAKRIGIATAGHSSVIANMAGFRLPIES